MSSINKNNNIKYNIETYWNMNTFSIIHHKSEDYFTKQNEYYIQQRKQ